MFFSAFTSGQSHENRSVAQTAPRPFVSTDPFGGRVFIENRGQFKSVLGQVVVYALDNGLEKIYFTPEGLVYELTKVHPLTEHDREEIEHGKKSGHTPNTIHYVTMNWKGGSSQPEIRASEKQSHYVTYGPKELNSNTFRKLVYSNVYKNIDIEFTFPENKSTGIKYNVIVHPGGDIRDVKILYGGEAGDIRLNRAGEVIIKTPLDDLVEHAPVTFYKSGEKVRSSFSLDKDLISFEIEEPLRSNETLIVDPWVSSTSTLTSNGFAYDVDYDFLGKTYVYGGYNPFKVACYSAAGLLQWVFSGSITNPSWTSAPITSQASNFGLNKFSSKTYIGQGYAGGGNLIVRLDASGNYDNFMNSANNQFQEVWDMGFHCISTDVFVLGGGVSSNITAVTMNSLTAQLTLSAFNPTNSGIAQDIVSHCIDDQANLFVIYAGNNGVANKIGLVIPSFTNSLWLQPSGFTSFSEQGNKNQYQGAGTLSSNGFNALAVNANYMFYYDGLNLSAYNKTTGAVTHSTTVPGNTLKRQGGIAVDDCNNLYIGGQGSVLCYNFNGTSFSTLTPISLGSGTTTPYVYDIKLDKTTKTLYVCGSNFAGVYSPAHTISCPTASSICLFNQGGIYVTSNNITCASLGSATCTATGGTGPFTYTWLPSMQTTSVATNLTPGSHQIIVHDQGANNTYTSTTYISPLAPFTGTVANPLYVNCFGQTSATAAVTNMTGGSGNETYLWTNGVTTQTTPIATGLGLGNHTVTVTDALTFCAFTTTFTVLQPPALTLAVVPSATSACAHTSITISPLVGGGTPNYTYSWTAGPTTPVYQASESQGGVYIYTITVTDAQNCPITGTVSLTFFPAPTITVNNPSVCPGKTATLTAAGAQTYTWSNNLNTSSFTVTPAANTVYTVSGTGTLCSSSSTVEVHLLPVPVPSLSASSPLCAGKMLQLQATGGASYQWTGPAGFTSGSSQPVITISQPANSGIYNATVTAANSCTAGSSVSVTVWPLPVISVSGSTVCVGQTASLTSNAGGFYSYNWSGPANYTSQLQNPVLSGILVSQSGNYTLTVADANNCSSTAVAHVTVSPQPVATFSTNGPQCEASELILDGGASAGALIYNWSGPAGFSSSLASPTIQNVPLSASGVYTLQVSHGPCTQSFTQNVIINALPSITVSANDPVCETKNLLLSLQTSPGVNAYYWQAPDGPTRKTRDFQRDSAQASYSGIYTITVSDLNLCAIGSTLQVDVLKNPVLTTSDVTVCLFSSATLSVSGADSYLWTGPLQQLSGSNPVITSAASINPQTFTVVGTALNTCTSAVTMQLYTLPLPQPTLSLFPGNTVCMDEEISFQGAGGVKYQWRGPLSQFYEGSKWTVKMIHSALAGLYTLTAIDGNGCRQSTTTLVNINLLPTGGLFGKTEDCVPLCEKFNFEMPSSANISTSWQISNKIFRSSSFFYCFSEPGEYVIKGSLRDTLTNCLNTLTVAVMVHDRPDADFTFVPERPIENQSEVFFTSTTTGEELTRFSWFFMHSQNFSAGSASTSFLFKEEGNYPVALVAENKWGCSDTVVKTVVVDPDFAIYVPNIFTPNGDDLNDIFLPSIRATKKYHLTIFDRWGVRLFESTDILTGWDGTYKGKLCKKDVYIWKINVTDGRGESKSLNGHVTLSP